MRVLFLALGATRRRSVTAESAQVLAEGGRAVVLVDQLSTWPADAFASGVETVELSRVELRHWPMVMERLLLFRAAHALFRILGWGPLARWARRARQAYDRRLAAPVHRRMRLGYRRAFRRARMRMIVRHLGQGASFDVLVVGDPGSIPDAVRLLAACPGTGGAPRICFGLDYLGLDYLGQDYAGSAVDHAGR